MLAQLDFPRRPVAAPRRSLDRRAVRRRRFASKIPDYIFGSYIDEALCMVKANGDRFYFSTNDLYSVYALTDGTGPVVERYIYTPYGAVLVLAPDGVTVRTESAYVNPWTFTGRRLDQETGLMYFRNRMYEVGLGRFIARDPIGYLGGINLYAAWFIPTLTDPTGQAADFDLLLGFEKNYLHMSTEWTNRVSWTNPFGFNWMHSHDQHKNPHNWGDQEAPASFSIMQQSSKPTGGGYAFEINAGENSDSAKVKMEGHTMLNPLYFEKIHPTYPVEIHLSAMLKVVIKIRNRCCNRFFMYVTGSADAGSAVVGIEAHDAAARVDLPDGSFGLASAVTSGSMDGFARAVDFQVPWHTTKPIGTISLNGRTRQKVKGLAEVHSMIDLHVECAEH